MTNTLSEAVSYGHAHASDFDWEGDCERFIHRAGAFTQSFDTAYLAGNASGPLDPDPTTAHPGEIHYWGGAWDPQWKRYDGHDAFELGNNLILCASNAVTDDWGWNLGTITWDEYQVTKGLPYRGHTFRHGTETLADLTPTDNTIHPLLQIENDKMWFLRSPEGAIYAMFTDPSGRTIRHLLNGTDWAPFQANGAVALTVPDAVINLYNAV